MTFLTKLSHALTFTARFRFLMQQQPGTDFIFCMQLHKARFFTLLVTEVAANKNEELFSVFDCCQTWSVFKTIHAAKKKKSFKNIRKTGHLPLLKVYIFKSYFVFTDII